MSVEDGDDCTTCQGDCYCGSDSQDLTDEELMRRRRDEERAAELFRAAGRAVPRWVHDRRRGAGAWAG